MNEQITSMTHIKQFYNYNYFRIGIKKYYTWNCLSYTVLSLSYNNRSMIFPIS